MIFWLNRRVERAIEGYLRTIVQGEMRVYRSADMTPRQFPCAVVRAHQNMRYKGQVYAANRMLVSVLVMSEFVREVDADAQLVENHEDVEERCVSAVLEALYLDDGELETALNAVGVDGVQINYAAIGSGDDPSVTSQSAEDGGMSIVEIPLVIHAGAKEL